MNMKVTKAFKYKILNWQLSIYNKSLAESEKIVVSKVLML
jgi:hypothetical protein